VNKWQASIQLPSGVALQFRSRESSIRGFGIKGAPGARAAWGARYLVLLEAKSRSPSPRKVTCSSTTWPLS
jgi:hypothetical protein